MKTTEYTEIKENAFNFEKMTMNKERILGTTKDYLAKQQTRPPFALVRKVIDTRAFLSQDSIIWLSHSTILGHIDNMTFIVDPMLSLRASPFSWIGPKRFEGSLTPIEELPNIDIIFITHNHYDHLDYKTIMALHEHVKYIYIPKGNALLLCKWGVQPSKIKEFSWFEEHKIDELTVCFCPTQHFSGRGLFDRDKTLWGSWVIKGSKHSVYVSGDSGYNQHFKIIGDTHGPFDIACIECGAYSDHWKEVHMRPEESVQAACDLGAKIMLPMHWAGFDLSTHAWDEPISRAVIKAKEMNMPLSTYMIGEVNNLEKSIVNTEWWISH